MSQSSMFPSPRFHRLEQPVSLLDWISTNPEPDLDLHQLLRVGSVYLNHQRISPETYLTVKLSPNDILRIHPKPKRYQKSFSHFRDLVVKETDEFFILNKPSGVPVHPTLDNFYENLLSWGEKDLGQKIFITHRLDVGTSGLIVYGKNGAAQVRFNSMLRHGIVKKIYRAESEITDSNTPIPPTEPWVHWMKPSYRAPKEVMAETFPEGIRCESRPLSLQVQELAGLRRLTVDLQLVTGRTHQIRAQMGKLGWPITGDLLYGSKSALGSADQWKLECRSLQFRVGDQELQVSL